MITIIMIDSAKKKKHDDIQIPRTVYITDLKHPIIS
jgi:hypothetical protein